MVALQLITAPQLLLLLCPLLGRRLVISYNKHHDIGAFWELDQMRQTTPTLDVSNHLVASDIWLVCNEDVMKEEKSEEAWKAQKTPQRCGAKYRICYTLKFVLK